MVISYSTVSLPTSLRVELKKNNAIVYSNSTAIPSGNGVNYGRIVIDLPNDAALNGVDELAILAEGAGNFNFTLHAINFQHVPSAPVVGFTPEPVLPVTQLPANDGSVRGVAEKSVSSSPSTLDHTVGTNLFQLHFDLTAANAFAGIVLNFDPNHNGRSTNLSAIPNLIFGINSTVVKNLKIELEDTHGNIYSTSNTDIVAAGYYKFLTSLAAARVDLSHIRSIKFGLDQYSVTSTKVGDLRLEIAGLQ